MAFPGNTCNCVPNVFIGPVLVLLVFGLVRPNTARGLLEADKGVRYLIVKLLQRTVNYKTCGTQNGRRRSPPRKLQLATVHRLRQLQQVGQLHLVPGLQVVTQGSSGPPSALAYYTSSSAMSRARTGAATAEGASASWPEFPLEVWERIAAAAVPIDVSLPHVEAVSRAAVVFGRRPPRSPAGPFSAGIWPMGPTPASAAIPAAKHGDAYLNVKQLKAQP